MKKEKMRLDNLLQIRYPTLSRAYVQSMIVQGNVFVDAQKITKAGASVLVTANVVLMQSTTIYVSRAGYKLASALTAFSCDVRDLIVLDAGISTGGFTDCLLQHGAARVYGIDVGVGQVASKIANDPRVILHEKTNLRYLETVGELVDLVTLDLSFISVTKVMDTVKRVLKENGKLLILMKPQFEAAKHEVGKGGIVRDEQIRIAIVDRVTAAVSAAGFFLHGIIPSPILGAMGNQEYLALFVRSDKKQLNDPFAKGDSGAGE